MVIVRDMWLTGFDAPCVHTMYVDKPMKKIAHELTENLRKYKYPPDMAETAIELVVQQAEKLGEDWSPL